MCRMRRERDRTEKLAMKKLEELREAHRDLRLQQEMGGATPFAIRLEGALKKIETRIKALELLLERKLRLGTTRPLMKKRSQLMDRIEELRLDLHETEEELALIAAAKETLFPPKIAHPKSQAA